MYHNKEEYLIKKHIGKTIISTQLADCGKHRYPIIFGGFVRDLYIHTYGARAYSNKGGSFELGAYQDPENDPGTFEQRTKCPVDIDIYLPHLRKFRTTVMPRILEIPGITVTTYLEEDGDYLKTLHGYSHHPLFLKYYCVHTCTLSYVYGRSMQTAGNKIQIRLDIITNQDKYDDIGVSVDINYDIG